MVSFAVAGHLSSSEDSLDCGRGNGNGMGSGHEGHTTYHIGLFICYCAALKMCLRE